MSAATGRRPPPRCSPGRPHAQPPTDTSLEQRVAAALATDPPTGRLTVSVVDRVAVVGGPVPDAATKRTAEAAVRGVDGLAAVRLNCWVPLSTDPFAERVKANLAPAKPAPSPPVKPVVFGELPPLALPLPGGVPPLPPLPEPVTAQRQEAGRRAG